MPTSDPGLPLKARALLFLYGTPNIVGCLLALGGLGLFFGGLIADWWLPIVAGLYGVGWLAAPKRPQLALPPQEPAAPKSLLEDVDCLIARCKKQLPAEALTRLQTIRETLVTLMPKLQGLADSGTIPMEQVMTLTNAVTRDLPATIANYIRLPQAYATLHQIESGKTAKALLLEQLDLLSGQLKKIADSAFQEDAEALVVNGLYLREKFHTTGFLPAKVG